MLPFIARSFYDYPAEARRTGSAQLVTISFSHYAELARWNLELAGVPFTEHGFTPIQHVLPALSVRLPRGGARHIASSSSMVGKPSPTALPALVRPGGEVLADSWAVAASTPLAPMEPALREVLDRELGVAARAFTYSVLLQARHGPVFTAMCTEGRHWGWRLLWACGLGAALRGALRARFRADDKAAVSAYVADVDALLAPGGPLAGALARRRAGQPFLGGAALGQADVALCAIAAPLVMPEEYGGRARPMARHFRHLLAADGQLRAHVERWRGTEVGAYVLDVYARFRCP
jgi:glutathione S-transferase